MKRLTLVTVLALALGACSDGASGPGTLEATVTGPSNLGAVVLEVTGANVTGFAGRSDTQAFGAFVSAAQGRHRVALVDQAGGRIDFGIQVDDMGADAPSISVIFAAGNSNQSLGTAGIEVRVEK